MAPPNAAGRTPDRKRGIWVFPVDLVKRSNEQHRLTSNHLSKLLSAPPDGLCFLRPATPATRSSDIYHDRHNPIPAHNRCKTATAILGRDRRIQTPGQYPAPAFRGDPFRRKLLLSKVVKCPKLFSGVYHYQPRFWGIELPGPDPVCKRDHFSLPSETDRNLLRR